VDATDAAGAAREVHTTCPLCGAERGLAFFEAERVPVHCNVLAESRAAALAAPRAEIRLVCCAECGLVYNDRFDPERMLYVEGYETSLHHSDVFREYAEELARDLVRRHGLRDRDVIEIGCGAGDFLRLLCALGGNRGLGFDPSYAGPERPDSEVDVRILARPYDETSSELPADLVCCRHVLEHVRRPLDLLAGVRRTLGARRDSLVFFEVPDALYTLRHGGIWDVIYEHCSYFTPRSLREAFVRAGFEPLETRSVYGGQFLALEARVASDAAPAAPEERDDTLALARAFHACWRHKVDEWRERVGELRARGATAAVWGAGSKGVTFLNTLGLDAESVPLVVDLHPGKQGRFVPGTAQRIVAPEELGRRPPDVVVVVNPLYREEIARRLATIGIAPEIAVA
jgi:SAM-dependent methyltransferase